MNILQPGQFASPSSVHVNAPTLLLNMICTAILAGILAWVYVRWGTSLSNRRSFARNFVLLATTTALIITVVKSSLALSLGLVGALSIVRFRSAIKEPEELAYLFLCIALGLGFGADQRMATVLALLLIVAIIAGTGWLRKRNHSPENLYITITNPNPRGLDLDHVVRAVADNCAAASLRRFDESPDSLEAAFLVEVIDYEQLNNAKKRLGELSDSMQITFVDQRGII